MVGAFDILYEKFSPAENYQTIKKKYKNNDCDYGHFM